MPTPTKRWTVEPAYAWGPGHAALCHDGHLVAITVGIAIGETTDEHMAFAAQMAEALNRSQAASELGAELATLTPERQP